jgi:hypothetical protein
MTVVHKVNLMCRHLGLLTNAGEALAKTAARLMNDVHVDLSRDERVTRHPVGVGRAVVLYEQKPAAQQTRRVGLGMRDRAIEFTESTHFARV